MSDDVLKSVSATESASSHHDHHHDHHDHHHGHHHDHHHPEESSSSTGAASPSSASNKFHSHVLVESVLILGVAKPPMGALVTMTTVKEQTSRSDTPEEREGNVIHSRSTVAVMTRKFTTQKTVPLIYDKDAQSVLIKGLSIEASFDWEVKLL